MRMRRAVTTRPMRAPASFQSPPRHFYRFVSRRRRSRGWWGDGGVIKSNRKKLREASQTQERRGAMGASAAVFSSEEVDRVTHAVEVEVAELRQLKLRVLKADATTAFHWARDDNVGSILAFGMPLVHCQRVLARAVAVLARILIFELVCKLLQLRLAVELNELVSQDGVHLGDSARVRPERVVHGGEGDLLSPALSSGEQHVRRVKGVNVVGRESAALLDPIRWLGAILTHERHLADGGLDALPRQLKVRLDDRQPHRHGPLHRLMRSAHDLARHKGEPIHALRGAGIHRLERLERELGE
eukprot:6212536-Pleurochrysis_carterae.AAC.3